MPSSQGSDLLFGAAAISDFMLGSRTEEDRKRIYGLVRKRLVPSFRIGTTVCARKSSLLNFIEEKERTGGDPPPRRKKGAGRPRGASVDGNPVEAP